MNVSTLNRVFTIAALWDLAARSRPRVAGCECVDCLGDDCGPECASRWADREWDNQTALMHTKIDALADPLGGLLSVFDGPLRVARTLAKQDTREGRRAARIMRKSYTRAS